jgi:transglutaminase-like putative cysteine protease
VQIEGGFNLAFDSTADTPLLLMIHVRPERHGDLIEPEKLTLYPQVPYTTYTDEFGNICTRLTAPAGRLSIWNRFLIADSGIAEQMPLYER